MTLPNFIVAGASRSGSTSLHRILDQHPNIFLAPDKEVHYFCSCKGRAAPEDNFKKGLNWYKEVGFGDYNGERAVGEITPHYMYFNYVPERMYNQLGEDIKLIFTLRNPIDRAYSSYNSNVAKGENIESCATFKEAIETKTMDKNWKDRKDKQLAILPEKDISIYLKCGFYATHIKRFLNYFPKENMFFIIFEEDFIDNRAETLANLFSFLGVENLDVNLEKKENSSAVPKFNFLRKIMYKSSVKKLAKTLIPFASLRDKIENLLTEEPSELSKGMRKKLFKKYFKSEIEELEEIIDRDLSVWKE